MTAGVRPATGTERHPSAPDIRAIILAGGRGTRFWPLSRRRQPKQFLPILGRAPMIEETVARVRPLIGEKRVLMVAEAPQIRVLRSMFPEIPRRNFVSEPEARSTGPALMLATAVVYLENPRAVAAVLPADHMIRDGRKFLRRLGAATRIAAETGSIVTFGIPPTSPATGFGYIRFDKDEPAAGRRGFFHAVRAFKEKPDAALARELVAAGDSWWNSGMFVWRADAFAAKLEAFAPDLFRSWTPLLKALKTKDRQALARVFSRLPDLSIDYALMEKAEGVIVGEGDFGWSDVGSWSALFDVWKRDAAGNALRGSVVALDTRDCLVRNPGRLTALVGVRDLVVVETDDVLLVCAKGQDQRVKDIVALLERSGRKRHL